MAKFYVPEVIMEFGFNQNIYKVSGFFTYYYVKACWFEMFGGSTAGMLSDPEPGSIQLLGDKLQLLGIERLMQVFRIFIFKYVYSNCHLQ